MPSVTFLAETGFDDLVIEELGPSAGRLDEASADVCFFCVAPGPAPLTAHLSGTARHA